MTLYVAVPRDYRGNESRFDYRPATPEEIRTELRLEIEWSDRLTCYPAHGPGCPDHIVMVKRYVSEWENYR